MSAENNPQNGWYRKPIAKILNNGVRILHEKAPSITPNHITLAGAGLVGIGIDIAHQRNKETSGKKFSPLYPLFVIGTGMLFDAFDGALARHIKENGGHHDTSVGQIVDVLTDRGTEGLMAAARIVDAHERGDRWGEYASLAAMVTNGIPSLMRAIAEARGQVVPEAGRDPLSFLGTRVGRAVIGTAATVFPKINEQPVQPVLDTITTVANLKTSAERWDVLKNTTREILPEEKMAHARSRGVILGVFTGGLIGAAALTHKYIHRK